MKQCPKCKETTRQRKCGTSTAGSQRYSCKHCKTKRTPKQKERGYSDQLRLQAIRMAVDGINYR